MDELQADLCDFIVEIRKENSEQYPSSSMYDLISGLSLYLEREHGFTNKLVSGAFRSVRNTLNNVIKERTAEGVGGKPERDPIMEENEQILWEKGEGPEKIRQTVFFLIGVRFGLRSLKEQYELRRYPDNQINIVKVDGKDALVYREFQSKTRQGGYLTGVKIQQGCLIVFVQESGLDVWLNCIGNIYFLVPGGPTIGPDSMFKLILSGSQGLTIGTPMVCG